MFRETLGNICNVIGTALVFGLAARAINILTPEQSLLICILAGILIGLSYPKQLGNQK